MSVFASLFYTAVVDDDQERRFSDECQPNTLHYSWIECENSRSLSEYLLVRLCTIAQPNARQKKRREKNNYTKPYYVDIRCKVLYWAPFLSLSLFLYSVLLFQMVSVLISEFVFTLMLLLLLLTVWCESARERVYMCWLVCIWLFVHKHYTHN